MLLNEDRQYEDTIRKLKRMTVANGATPAEEAVAKSKIEELKQKSKTAYEIEQERLEAERIRKSKEEAEKALAQFKNRYGNSIKEYGLDKHRAQINKEEIADINWDTWLKYDY